MCEVQKRKKKNTSKQTFLISFGTVVRVNSAFKISYLECSVNEQSLIDTSTQC